LRRDQIPDFRWLNGKSFKDALVAVAHCSHSLNVAASYRGGIQLQTGVRNPDYDRPALREFQLALENGDILVQVEGRTVPAEFWQPDWFFEVDGERLLSFRNNVSTVEGVAPYLVVPQAPEGPDPPSSSAKNLSDTAQPSEGTTQTSELPNDHKSPAQTTPQTGVASSADKPGPKPGVSGKVRVAELADEILRDEKIHLPEGRGRTTRLAQLIHERLTKEGQNYQLDSVKRTLRALKE
jgi:hypothetical protein